METPKEVVSTRHILEQLEPIAADAPVNTLQQRGMQEVAIVSSAISLKRIADSLAGNGLSLDEVLTNAINNLSNTLTEHRMYSK